MRLRLLDRRVRSAITGAFSISGLYIGGHLGLSPSSGRDWQLAMDLRGEHHCIGYLWREGVLNLRMRKWPESSTDVEFPMASELRFCVTGTRRCTGFFDFASSTRFPCPDATTPEKKPQCEACVEKEGFVPWMRCDGRAIPDLQPAVRSYVESPHVLYLACFGDAQVKVGMASALRQRARLDDQGPLTAMYVAQGSGIQIRQLEVEISRLGYVELMRRSRKRRLLTEGESVDEARPRIEAALTHIRGQLSEELAALMFDAPQTYEIPSMAKEARGFRELEPITLEEGKIYDVRVLAASGSVAVVDDGGLKSSIEISDLVGKVLELQPEGEVERDARQIGLF